jgi:DMSO reductase anchor subunit
MNNAEFLIPLSFFAMILGIVYLSYRKKERMALIQSGRDASILDQDGRCYSSLKWGLLLFGVGLGLLIAEFLAKYDVMSAEAAYFSMASIFGGMALIIDFFIEKYRKESDASSSAKE